MNNAWLDSAIDALCLTENEAQMKKRCPTCRGSGEVLWQPPPNANTLCISPWPTEVCQTCSGSGWVSDPSPPHPARG